MVWVGKIFKDVDLSTRLGCSKPRSTWLCLSLGEGSGNVGCLELCWGVQPWALGEVGGSLAPSPAAHLEFNGKRAEQVGDTPSPGLFCLRAWLNISDGLVLRVV